MTSYTVILKVLKYVGRNNFFLDSDDYFSKNKLSIVINEFLKRKN